MRLQVLSGRAARTPCPEICAEAALVHVIEVADDKHCLGLGFEFTLYVSEGR